jgi:hypothetical protein
VTTLNEIVQQYGAAYRAKYGEKLLPSHQRAIRDLELCRTEALGGHVYECPTCAENEYKYHSCRNRHCPRCQAGAGEKWLIRQEQLLLPTPYFMVTFTLPEALRAITRSNQRVMYDLLFRSGAAALQELASDPRFVGGQIGLVGVLHTWSRAMVYHPHVHFLVPGGGLSADGQSWLSSRQGFLVHVRPLSKLFRAKFRAGLKKSGLLRQVPAAVWRAGVGGAFQSGRHGAGGAEVSGSVYFSGGHQQQSDHQRGRGTGDLSLHTVRSEKEQAVYPARRGVYPSFFATRAATWLCQSALLRTVCCRAATAVEAGSDAAGAVTLAALASDTAEGNTTRLSLNRGWYVPGVVGL